jgi:hypothetical protein
MTPPSSSTSPSEIKGNEGKRSESKEYMRHDNDGIMAYVSPEVQQIAIGS